MSFISIGGRSERDHFVPQQAYDMAGVASPASKPNTWTETFPPLAVLLLVGGVFTLSKAVACGLRGGCT